MDLSILEKKFSEVKENDFFKSFSKDLKEYKAFENDINCHYYSKEKGVDFIFTNNILAAIHFFGKDNNNDTFKGKFPFHINIYDNKLKVYEKFGNLELENGKGETLPILGKMNDWAIFKIDNYYFRFEFDDNDDIVLITVSIREY